MKTKQVTVGSSGMVRWVHKIHAKNDLKVYVYNRENVRICTVNPRLRDAQEICQFIAQLPQTVADNLILKSNTVKLLNLLAMACDEIDDALKGEMQEGAKERNQERRNFLAQFLGEQEPDPVTGGALTADAKAAE